MKSLLPLAALAGCSFSPSPAHHVAPQDIAASTFKVEATLEGTPLWTGTSWIAQSDNTGSLLVTAGHVCHMDGLTMTLGFDVEDRFGHKEPVELIRFSDKYDLCLLGTAKYLGQQLDLAEVMPVYDEPVVMVGAPMGIWGCKSGSTVERCGMAPISHGNYGGGTLVSMPAVHGYSGSAVLSADGVIGVLVEGYEGYDSLSFIEPLDHLREFLAE